MKRIILRVIIGFILGGIIYAVAGNGHTLPAEVVLASLLWGIGFVYAFEFHVNTLMRMLNPGIKLSVISFLTFRNGFMGSIPILIFIAYCFMLGWIYGLVKLVIDITKCLL